jgi:hypothetical protein
MYCILWDRIAPVSQVKTQVAHMVMYDKHARAQAHIKQVNNGDE